MVGTENIPVQSKLLVIIALVENTKLELAKLSSMIFYVSSIMISTPISVWQLTRCLDAT